MILDAEGIHLPPELNVLGKAPFDFYLTGSRYFSCAREDSDWDFMVQDGLEVRNCLEAYAIKEIESSQFGGVRNVITYSEHCDSLTNAVWELPNGIQVQLVQDVELKREARDLIKAVRADFHRKADGPTRSRLWTRAIDFLSTIEHEFVPDEDLPF